MIQYQLLSSSKPITKQTQSNINKTQHEAWTTCKNNQTRQLTGKKVIRRSVVRRLTVGPTGHGNPARDSNPESPDIC